jgi:hypothetical protein
MVERTDPELWEEVKASVLKKLGGKWSARAAQLAVLEYKKRGGGYKGKKPTTKSNSLAKWTQEDWDYAGTPKKSRYLPKKVRQAMPSALKTKENRKKGDRLGKDIPYSKELNKLMKKKGIY